MTMMALKWKSFIHFNAHIYFSSCNETDDKRETNFNDISN